MARQLKLALPEWGGRREGAGRPRTLPHPGLQTPGIPHLERPELNPRHPVHVTLRVQPGIGYLRSQLRAAAIVAALKAVSVRDDFQVVDYVIRADCRAGFVRCSTFDMLDRFRRGPSL